MGISFKTSPASDAKPPRRGSSPTCPRLQTRTWRSKAPAGPCTSAPAPASPWPYSRQWPSARAARHIPSSGAPGCVATPKIICHSPARSWRVAFSYISSCRSGVSVHMPLTMATAVCLVRHHPKALRVGLQSGAEGGLRRGFGGGEAGRLQGGDGSEVLEGRSSDFHKNSPFGWAFFLSITQSPARERDCFTGGFVIE